MTAPYRRLVLHLSSEPVHERVVGATAEVARLLGVEFHAVFVEDESLFHLAGLPFGREIRLPAHEWHPMDAARIASDYRHAAAAARGPVQRAAHARGIEYSFEVVREARGAPQSARVGDEDIVVVPPRREASADSIAPRPPAPAGTGALLLFAGVLAERRSGPIVAVVDGDDDPNREVAAAIARAAHEPLLVVARGPAGDEARHVLDRLAGVRERLIVASRGAAIDPDALARARGVPVLLLGRSETA